VEIEAQNILIGITLSLAATTYKKAPQRQSCFLN